MTGTERHMTVRPATDDRVQLVIVEEDDDGLMREVLHIDLAPEAAYVLGRRLTAHAQEFLVQ